MGDNYSELELRKTENILNDIESRVLNMRRLLRKYPDKVPEEVVNTKFIITTLLGELPIKSNVYSSE